MKKGYIFLLSLIVLLSGCCKDKDKKSKKDRMVDRWRIGIKGGY